jgi:hypothetical protein
MLAHHFHRQNDPAFIDLTQIEALVQPEVPEVQLILSISELRKRENDSPLAGQSVFASSRNGANLGASSVSKDLTEREG